jgi:hypothetical protein
LKAKIENSGKALVVQMPDAQADIGAVHGKDLQEDKALLSPQRAIHVDAVKVLQRRKAIRLGREMKVAAMRGHH